MGDLSADLKYDHDFYILSYADLLHHNPEEGRAHFLANGMAEGRYCSSYHLLIDTFPELAEAFNLRGLKFDSPKKQSPLELTQSFMKILICGHPSSIDTQAYKAERMPTIAKHGRIHEWCGSYFNSQHYRVLELGSRAVCSDSAWKQYLPDCSYVGFDVMEGKNVDVVGDAHKLSEYFDQNSFDLIMSFAVFEHLAMPWIVAEEIAKLLKVGGVLAIETHFSFSEHELPWHFFQFNSNALEVLFNKYMGFETIDKGMDSPMIGRFAHGSAEYLSGTLVGNLYCHSSLISQKVRQVAFGQNLDWRQALPSVIEGTMYPSNTSQYSPAK